MKIHRRNKPNATKFEPVFLVLIACVFLFNPKRNQIWQASPEEHGALGELCTARGVLAVRGSMRLKKRIVGKDCRDIKHCCGPCEAEAESEQLSVASHTQVVWKAGDELLLDLRNVCMCAKCWQLYEELRNGVLDCDAESIEQMCLSTDAIMLKLNIECVRLQV